MSERLSDEAGHARRAWLSTLVLLVLTAGALAGSGAPRAPLPSVLPHVADGLVTPAAQEARTSSAWTWTNDTSGPHPSPRSGAAMAWDASDGYVLLFGGAAWPGGPLLDDTWTYKAGQWTNITSTAGTAPSPRSDAGMTYDAGDGYVLLFGGQASGTWLTDTWTFTGGRWTELAPTSPPSGYYSSNLAYDAADGYVLLYTGSGSTLLTWAFHAGQWWVPTTSGSPPDWYYQSGMAYDASSGFLLHFGGWAGGNSFDGTTAEYLGGTWSQPAQSPAPSPRSEFGLVYLPTLGGEVLFGGTHDSVGNLQLDDTWTWVRGSWTNLTTGTSPPGGEGADLQGQLVEDMADQCALLFTPQGDTWCFSGGATPTPWVPQSPALANAPPPRSHGGIADDTGDGYVVLFGGDSWAGDAPPLGDTWEWAGGGWTNVTSSQSTPPPARDSMAMTYDTAAGEVLMFGGCPSYACPIDDDTWAFKAGQWSELSPTTSPPPLYGAEMTYDPALSEVILFGGNNAHDTGGAQNETWAFSSGEWTELTPASAPSPRYYAPMTYDANDDAVLLFGGESSTGAPLGDTWEFTHNGTWKPITTSPTDPSARREASLFFDPTLGQAVLTEGSTQGIGGQGVNDTWTFGSGVWTNVTAGSSPFPRAGAEAVFDQEDGYGLLFGGAAPQVLGDTWTYAGGTSPLSAHAYATPTSGASPLAVDFSVSVTGGVAPYSYLWNFDDGSSFSTSQAPAHTYTTAGSYLATVAVKDSQGNSVSPSVEVTVTSPAALSAKASASPISGEVPLTVGFTGSASGGEAPYSYDWKFGDGDTSLLQDPSHTYSYAGVFAVELTVADNASHLASAWVNVSVTGSSSPLSVSLVASPSSLQVGESTLLAGTAKGGVAPYTYSWSGLPDGCVSADTGNLTCSPVATGTFVVEFEATDSADDHANTTTDLLVSAAPPISVTVSVNGSNPASLALGAKVLLQAVATGGTGLTLSFNWSDLPAGCSSADTDALSCRPAAVGHYNLTVTVSAPGTGASARLELNVYTAPPSPNPPTPLPFGFTDLTLLLLLLGIVVVVAVVVAVLRRSSRRPVRASAPSSRGLDANEGLPREAPPASSRVPSASVPPAAAVVLPALAPSTKPVGPDASTSSRPPTSGAPAASTAPTSPAASMVKCAHCGALADAWSVHCPGCGEMLDEKSSSRTIDLG